MSLMDKDLQEQLCKTYLIEAEEHIASINDAILQIESTPTEFASCLEVIYRCAHSLKGGARIVNLPLIEHICQSAESLLAKLRDQNKQPEASILAALSDVTANLLAILQSPDPASPALKIKSDTMRIRQQLDALSNNVTSAQIKQQEPDAKGSVPSIPKTIEPKEETQSLIPKAQPKTAAMIMPAAEIQTLHKEPNQKKSNHDTVRVPATKLDDLLLQAEEMLTLKLAYREHINEIKALTESMNRLRRQLIQKDQLEEEGIKQLDRELLGIVKNTQQIKRHCDDANRQASSLIETLIQDAKSLLMFPFSSIAQGFPQSVRQIAQELKKDIEFQLFGETLELDRRILQSIKDPLIHLLRNSIDHGVEPVHVRLANGKPAKATIRLSAAYTDNGKAEITLFDDGKGIDFAQIKVRIQEKNLATAEQIQQMTNQELLPYIFHSGFSSKQEVTHLSGRGIGLAIVQENVERLGGTISIESESGKGTTFRLILPLTLASFRGIQIKAGQCHFAVPTLNVSRVLRLKNSDIKLVEGRPSFRLDQRIIPIVSLQTLLGVPPSEDSETYDFKTLLILGADHEQIAYEIDEILGEDDLLLKSLGPQLIRVKNISGATVLGDGSILPILNTRDLIKSAQGQPQPVPLATPTFDNQQEPIKKKILIVDDSITSRTLLKNVLESYGYDVKTAVDGMDAFHVLQEEYFDLVSSDIEMPHMDGFELTARIRADESLSRLPVVLVTSLESQQDKERGVEVGADAYIVKSSFDQSNLLEIIRKFI